MIQPSSQRAPRRVLVVDDTSEVRLLIAHMLRRSGVEVEEAESGVAALEKARDSSLAGRPFGLAFMDIQMPEMDGLETTRRLRESSFRFPIVALTAHALSFDRERCLASGCDDYLTKPIVPGTIRACLDRF